MIAEWSALRIRTRYRPGAKSGIVVLTNAVNCPAGPVGAQILATLNGQAPARNLEELN